MSARFLLVVLFAICSSSPTWAQESKSPLQSVDEFASQDYRGQEFKLSDIKDEKLVVLAFLGTECPLVKLYGSRLQTIADKYKDQSVTVIGINSNRQDNVTEIGAYMRRHNLEFRMLKDISNKVADQLGAERTPEIFLLDAERNVRYRGRIDDQYGVGYSRRSPSVSFLENAIDELLAGKEVPPQPPKPLAVILGESNHQKKTRKSHTANKSLEFCRTTAYAVIAKVKSDRSC